MTRLFLLPRVRNREPINSSSSSRRNSTSGCKWWKRMRRKEQEPSSTRRAHLGRPRRSCLSSCRAAAARLCRADPARHLHTLASGIRIEISTIIAWVPRITSRAATSLRMPWTRSSTALLLPANRTRPARLGSNISPAWPPSSR